MKRELGIAYCGLACCVCSENTACPGCRSEGCRDKEQCLPLRCCREKGIRGCWECVDFPCGAPILGKLRVRTFAAFSGTYGEARLMDALEENEKQGVVYHDPGKLTGDYDRPNTEEGILGMLMGGTGI